ncbi:Uncharacterised protein [Bordetella pertussis]|nr:Uncharacterised protein [Bordetella pertussis]CFL89865.1 Uncharacterised protein [Bordetella pertussis]CFM12292.1 Uncharacterised protein [Bordetella pertussis]CFM41841.1 Uncharacterised protein [Bordetella pertussis]CFN52848.1 Uncharacterised protein [Bordetella pertussis]
MAGSSRLPMAITSATPEPDSAPNIRQASTATTARPPLISPTMAAHSRTMRCVRPAPFISWAARMNRGMASSVKLSRPTTYCWAATIIGAAS